MLRNSKVLLQDIWSLHTDAVHDKLGIQPWILKLALFEDW